MRLTNLKKCPICGSEAIGEFQAKYLRVSKCGNIECQHIYAASQLDRYGVQKHSNIEAEFEHYCDRNKRLVRFWRRYGFLRDDSVVLDFGAGVGHIAKAIRDAGTKEITCIEADIESQLALREDGFKVAIGLEDCRNDFDTVLLVEVIEHIDSPVEILKMIKAHMRSNGKIFLSTPCGETRSGSRATNAYDTPEHVHFFTETSLRLTIKKAGLSKIDFLRVPELYPMKSGFTGIMSAQIRAFARAFRDSVRGYSHLIVFIS